MSKTPPNNSGKKKPERVRPVISAVLEDGSLVEALSRPEEGRTLFCVSSGGEFRYENSAFRGGERLVPYASGNNLLQNEVIFLPSEPEEYGSEAELVAEIRDFLHRYVDVSPLFETIAAYYVLLSWVYDAFNELPYLRVRGDAGSGKTRFLLTVGSICYKPIFASGASTVSPLFRILDAVRGTLIIDEGDFRFSDERAEIVKILNNGNARGFPVLRSEVSRKGEVNPTAFHVFGPKLVATRGYFQDRALESRCLTEEMGQGQLREEVPINLPPEWKDEALRLRNRLLLFRFRHHGKTKHLEALVDRAVEPRLAQVFTPLLSVVDDEATREELRALARRYHRELIAERGLETEAQVLEVIRDMLPRSETGRLALKDITSWFLDRHGEEYDRKVTVRWIGSLIRKKLQLRTRKSHGNFVIPPEERPKLERLFEKYGVSKPDGMSGEGSESPVNAG